MSPEQAAGERELDAGTDIYSLGAVLYEMLAGEPPFTGPTAQAVIAKRLSEPPPSVRRARPAVPEAVDAALQRSLAPVRADRFATAAELGAALHAVPTSSGTVPTGVAAPAGDKPASRRRLPLAALAMILGLLIGAGALFAWRRSHTEATSGNERRIAVLPFQNLGDSTEEYFAEGITDAVRGKLTALPSMRVTGSNSSAQYRGTSKSPQEIGRELGVDYLLVGKVRWQKGGQGASRVQVSPELIEVATADARWQQPFDAAITDVFQVQADIAGRVAEALDVAIGTRQQRALEARPTQNLAAYDAFLKGKALRALGTNPVSLRQAVASFEQAVALDSSFVAAWAHLSVTSSVLYSNGAPSPTTADRARTAAERALTLDPEYPGGYWALGGYYRLVTGEAQRATEQYRKGLALSPRDVDLLRAQALAEVGLGRWQEAVEHLRQTRSFDPRSAPTAFVLGEALLWLRRYDEALATYDQAIALAPSAVNMIQGKAMTLLAQGDLAGARSVLARPPAEVDLPTFVAYVAAYWDTYWALDDDQRALVKRLTPTAFDGDVGTWGLALAGVYEVEGDMRRAAAYADSARAAFEQQLTATPEDAQRRVLLGVALAYMGRKDAAVREGERVVSLEPVTTSAQSGAYFQHQLARIYILVGEPEKAIDQLEALLKIPYYVSPGWLRIDPTFDPLRKNPRFQKLVGGAG